MGQKLLDFIFKNTNIRSYIDETGEIWVCAKDVCEALNISWKGNGTLNTINDNWKGVRSFRTPRGEQQLIFIKEAAVYKLAFRSNKPEAEEFTDFIADEVIPALRKEGYYVLPKSEGSTFKGGLSHLPQIIIKAAAGDTFADSRLKELDIAVGQPIPKWMELELTLKTQDEIWELVKKKNPIAIHLIKDLFGVEYNDPQLDMEEYEKEHSEISIKEAV